MANICYTTYVITGTKGSVENLMNALTKITTEVESGNWQQLSALATHYGIDYEKSDMHVRGDIYSFNIDEEDEGKLFIETDTAWLACTELFQSINGVLNNELSISYREMEPDCEIFCVHDEGGHFPEECCVFAEGEDWDYCEDIIDTIDEVIEEWCSSMNFDRGSRSQKEMVELINNYEYDDDSYFTIYPFKKE